MRIISLIDKKEFNEFVTRANGSFLQSWEWGEFQEKMGQKIWRLGVTEDHSAGSGQDERLVAAATIIKKKLPFGKSYFYSPRGPISHNTEHIAHITESLFSEIKKIAKSEGAVFFRLEPLNKFQIPKFSAEGGSASGGQFQIHKTIDVQPSKTLILDLSKSEEELLAAMHQKTRYNIRLAEKKGVKIIEGGVERFDDFWQLMAETEKRDDFRLHGKEYYRAMLKMGEGVNPLNPPLEGGLKIDAPLRKGGQGGYEERKSPQPPLSKGGDIKLFFAEYQGRPLAAGIFSFFGDTATYLHGASSDTNREVMAPYLLQWRVIKLAKSAGYKFFDLFGIDEKKWPGVTRFKGGFGGLEKNYPGTFDMVLDKRWYWVYRMARGVRRNI